MRALSASSSKGVLTLVRGFRRGELRLYEGEVTSAQLGGLHGLAAFHQLLLWPEARFELQAKAFRKDFGAGVRFQDVDGLCHSADATRAEVLDRAYAR